MKTFFLLSFLLLGFACAAQITPAPPPGVTATLPAGVQFPAQLITHLDARKPKVGDEVKLEVTANLRGPGGTVALPQGAKLIGALTDVHDRKGGDGTSSLSFVITRAEWHGGTMALHATPTAVVAPRMRTDRAGGDSAGLGGEGGRGAGGSGGRSNPTPVDTSAMIASAIGQELKGTSVHETGDPKTATAIVSSSRDVSLPSGTVVTLRQVKPPEQ